MMLAPLHDICVVLMMATAEVIFNEYLAALSGDDLADTLAEVVVTYDPPS